ncbi:MAG: hypothetical protein SGJ19_09620 [Planctomycetia bacterium]|nr:hypothetical protein [Planctomycetia bacterium]
MATKPLTRPRWLRYSLRAFFAFVTLAAIFFAWVAKERRQSAYERQVADRLQAGGVFLTALGGPYDSLDQMKLGKPQGWWRDLARRILGERVLIVFQDYQKAQKDIDLTPLAGLENVREMSLASADVTDLTPLAGLQSLSSLTFHSLSATDLTPLGELDGLQQLNLLVGSRETTNLAPLARLDNLKSLYFCCYGDVDLAPLAELHSLQELWLLLATLSTIDHMPLAKMSGLKSLHLTATTITPEQLESLQKALPNCKIQ